MKIQKTVIKRINFIVMVFFSSSFIFSELHAQVGIGTETPTNTLHIKPVDTDEDPLRVEHLNKIMQGDSALLVVDPATGIVRYLHIDSLFNYMANSNDLDLDATNELQDASGVPLSPAIDIDNDGNEESNVQQAISILSKKLPKGTYKSIGEARLAGLIDGDSFWADPKGVFGCSGCVVTLHPGMD